MQLIDELTTTIRENYVLADRADAIADDLLNHSTQFSETTEPNKLAADIGARLREISGDGHFNVHYVSDDPQTRPPEFAGMARSNHYFTSAQRLAGNVGYLELQMFPFEAGSAEVAIGAMAFLANTDALIFDLRRNRGGEPRMIQLLLSYLFDESQHINSFYNRPNDTHTQIWSLPYVPGKRMSSVPVYVLTSRQSISAAEEFAYDIQQMQRGTVVGETTAGAAHPVAGVRVAERFVVNMPVGRPINPVSQTNWEGVGVEPDIAVAAEEALAVAHLHAIRTLLEQAEDDATRAYLQWELESAETSYHPVTPNDLARFVGTYEAITVELEDGQLILRSKRGEWPMTPINDNTFAVDEIVRMRFSADSLTRLIRDSDHPVTYSRS